MVPLLQRIAVLLLVFAPSVAQQSPSIFVEKFNKTVSYRTNVCERQRMLWNNAIELPDALRGLNLTVTITNYPYANENAFFTLANNQIDEGDPGLFAVILDEVARRAGFEWRNSFGVAAPLNATTDGDKTWTDILEWGVETFDISMEKWGRSVDRMSRGISFPAGWYDSSVVLVEQYDDSQSQRVVNLWSFLDPFSTMVWILIAVAIVVTGLLYWFLEYLDVDADERDLDQKPIASIFYAATTFTGHFEFRPNTHAARIIGFSWTFWALIVASAYTANMASFLVSPRIEVYRVSSIAAAVKQGASICVQGGGVIESILKDKYPDLKLVGKVGSEKIIFDSLRLPITEGGCHAAAHQFNTFRVYQRNKEVNYDCSISSEGRIVEPIPAGMATAIDTGIYQCTSLISHVLDYHLTAMISEGFMESAWQMHVNKIASIDCARDLDIQSSGGDQEDTFSLGLPDIGGIFILHFILAFVAIALAMVQWYYYPSARGSQTLSEVFGVKQARTEIIRRRESIQVSISRRRSTMNADSSQNQNQNERMRNTLSMLRAEYGDDDSGQLSGPITNLR